MRSLVAALVISLLPATAARADTSPTCPPPPPRYAALTAVGPTGVRWSVPIPVDETLGGQSLPLVLGDSAFIATQGRAVLVDDADGAVRWSTTLGFAPYGRVADGDLIAVAGFTHVVGLRKADGSQTWSWTPTGRGLIGDPVVLDHHLIAVQSGDGTTTALDLRTGRPRWIHKAGGDDQYVIGDRRTVIRVDLVNDRWTAFDGQTGRTLWRLHPTIGQPTYVAGHVLGPVEGAKHAIVGLRSWDARTGDVEWTLPTPKNTTDFIVTAAPQVLLVARTHQLLAVQPSDGKVRWTAHLPKGVTADLDSQTGIHGGVVAVQQGDPGGYQYVGRRLTTGKVLWRSTRIVGGQQGGQATFTGTTAVSAFVAGTSGGHGEVQAVRTTDGHLLFDVTTDLPASGPAAIDGGGAVVLTETLGQGCLL